MAKMNVEFPSYSTPACVRRVDTVVVAMDITTAIKVAAILDHVNDETRWQDFADLDHLVAEMRKEDEVGVMVPTRPGRYVISPVTIKDRKK